MHQPKIGRVTPKGRLKVPLNRAPLLANDQSVLPGLVIPSNGAALSSFCQV